MIGSESKWAEYKRAEREKHKEIGQCPKMSKKNPIEIDTDTRDKEEKSEFWENWNKSQVKKSMKISKLEDLNIANRNNQVLE